MGKQSTKKNKNVYQTTREELGYTRERAAEVLEALSPERIERIESEKSDPHPDEVLIMAEKYKNAAKGMGSEKVCEALLKIPEKGAESFCEALGFVKV